MDDDLSNPCISIREYQPVVSQIFYECITALECFVKLVPRLSVVGCRRPELDASHCADAGCRVSMIGLAPKLQRRIVRMDG